MNQFPFSKLPMAEIIDDLKLRLVILEDGVSHSISLKERSLQFQESRSRTIAIPQNLTDVDIDSFEHLETIWGAIKEVALNTNAPGRMIIVSALASFSSIAQGLYEVRSPLGSIHALSLNTITIALSGERKTTVDRFFSKIFSILMEIINDRIQELNSKTDSELEQWNLDYEILKNEYKRVKREGDSTIIEEEALAHHKSLKPQTLDYLMMVHDDFTLSALLQSLNANMPIASIMTSEGAKVLDDANMKCIPILNKLWDGVPVQVSRISRESFWLKKSRLTTSLMIQPEVIKKIIEKRHDELRSSGYLARALLCYPQSTIGQRPIIVSKAYTQKTDLLYSRLGSLCIELLLSLSDPEFKPKELKLDQEAEKLWVEFSNYVESNMNSGGVYQSATDHASKLAENVLRTAGVLHAIEFGEGDITGQTLNAAIKICMQSSKDFVDYFVPLPQDVINGQKLLRYLHDNYGVYLTGRSANQLHFDERFIRRNRVLQCGPLTKAEQLNQALSHLVRKGIVSVMEEVRSKGRGVVYIDLIPNSALPFHSGNGYPLRFSSLG